MNSTKKMKSFKILKLILNTTVLTLVFILAYTYSFAQNFISSGYMKGLDVKVTEFSTLVFADVDGDEDLDLYVGERYGTISVYENDGENNFISTGSMNADGATINVGFFSTPAFADLDNDNDLDLYVGEQDGNINVFTNDGNGNFSSSGNLNADGFGLDIGSNSSPVFADIDKDNDLDLYVGEYDGNINVYLNDGNGNLQSAGNLQSGSSNIDVGIFSNPGFADIDNDNDLDLYVGESNGSIKVFLNNGSGNFTASSNLQADGSDIVLSRSFPAFADLDDNNISDLYVGFNEGFIKLYTNDGSGNFSLEGNMLANPVTIDIGIYSAPALADLDNDNDLDLYIGQGLGLINVYLNDGTENFISAGYLKSDGVDINHGMNGLPVPEFADIDNDNDLDLYVGDANGTITIYINDGNGNFSTSGLMKSNGSDIDVGANSCPAFIDIDGDYDIDLCVGNNEGTIYKYLNNGIGSFIYAGNLQYNGSDIDVSSKSRPTFADIDQDGDYDLFLGENYGYVYIYKNNGTGSFESFEYFKINGSTFDIGSDSSPFFANIDNSCYPSLFIGEIGGKVIKLSIVDVTSPVITSTYDNVTVSNQGVCEADLPDYANTLEATDNCDNNLEITQSPEPGTTISGATNDVTLTVTDDAGNTAQITFNVAIDDNTSPVISSTHNDQILSADVNCQASLPNYIIDVVATDNCDDYPVITQNPEPGTTISGATNEITITATDNAGNTAEISFNVSIEDDTNPTITCSDNQAVHADETHIYTVQGVEFDPTETTDNCEVANVENDFNNTATLENAQLPEGTTTIVWTITDIAGNENTCSFEVTVNAFVGIETLQQKGISIYPNPTNGIVNFEFAENNIQKLTISDITGKQIIEKTEIQQNEQIDLSGFDSGIYIISIHTDNETFTTKVIKE